MSYKTKIDELKPFDYSLYKDISSCEKLMAFAVNKLVSMDVPLTFNYICVASFKLFPEKFCCDEEFKEFPSVDRLNRTMMHLKYVKNGKPYITGTTKKGYVLTSFGKAKAIEVESVINNAALDKNIKAPIVDEYKKGGGEYYRLIESEEYKNFLKTHSVDDSMFIWRFFDVTPFTQIKRIKKSLDDIKQYAKALGNGDCILFVNKIKETI